MPISANSGTPLAISSIALDVDATEVLMVSAGNAIKLPKGVLLNDWINSGTFE